MRKATNGAEAPKARARRERQRMFFSLPLNTLKAATDTGATIVAHDATEAGKQFRAAAAAKEGATVLVEVLAIVSAAEQKRMVLKEETWGE